MKLGEYRIQNTEENNENRIQDTKYSRKIRSKFYYNCELCILLSLFSSVFCILYSVFLKHNHFAQSR